MNTSARDLAFLRSGEAPDWSLGRRGTLRVADLFCGCGGMTLGLAEAALEADLAFQSVLALDTDPDAVKAYQANFGLAEKVAVDQWFDGSIGSDITDGEAQRRGALEAGVGLPDILVGGPPCQGNSDLNNHTRRNDDRNALYAKMARAARVLGPTVAIVENVPAVIHDANNVVHTTRAELEALDYCVAEGVVSLLAVGVPQRRRRHLLIASAVPEVDPVDLMEWLAADVEARTVAWAVEDLLGKAGKSGIDDSGRPSPQSKRRIAWLFDHDAYDLDDSQRPPCHRDKPHTYRSVYGRLRWDAPANTITTGFVSMGQGCYVHPLERRTITPHEAARVQGFPDYFRFETEKRTKLAKLIGNAVPPLLTLAIGRQVLPAMLDAGVFGRGATTPNTPAAETVAVSATP